MRPRSIAIAAFEKLMGDLLLEGDEDRYLPEQLQAAAVTEFERRLKPNVQGEDAAVAVFVEWLIMNLPDDHEVTLDETMVNIVKTRFLQYETEETTAPRKHMIRIRIPRQLRDSINNNDGDSSDGLNSDDNDEQAEDSGNEHIWANGEESDGNEDDPEAQAGPANQLGQGSNKVACQVVGCVLRLNPQSVKTHISRAHPQDYATLYPGQQITYYPCPQPGCGMLQLNTRNAPLEDHLSRDHGIDIPRRFETNDRTYLQRKSVQTLKQHLAIDGQAINAYKDRIENAETRLRNINLAYTSTHSLDLAMRWQTGQEAINGLGAKAALVAELVTMRTDLAYDSGVKVGSRAKWEATALRSEAAANAAEAAVAGGQ